MLASSPESVSAFQRMIFDACVLFRPPEKLTVAEWADKYLFLSSEYSARPGKYYVSTAEYQREPLEALSPGSGFDEVVQCWSSQTGKSQNAQSLVGYHMHHDPAPILFLEPDENLAKGIAQDRIGPMIRDTPVLAPLFGQGKGQGNDTLHKTYPGGQLDIGWASSPTGLAMRSKRIVVTDEEDSYVLATNKEGNPVGLAQARMATYSELGTAMHFRVSSPRLKRTSYIWPAFEASDQRHFYVACPQCGHSQTLRWEQLKWPVKDGKPDSKAAYYVCEQNGCVIEHRDKYRMVRLGKWIAHNPGGGNGRTAGFHLNALYSTIGFSWSKLVDRYLECEGKPEKLQVFTNTLLGLPWDEQAEGADLNALQRRAENYAAQAPEGVLVVTCGADVQKNRIEATKWGYGQREHAWVIEHRVFYGNTDVAGKGAWEEFTDWRREKVTHQTGVQIPVTCTFVDSSDGNRTQAVYAYARRYAGEKVFPIKGSSQPGAPVVGRANPRTRLVIVGSSTIKDLLYARFQIVDTAAPGYTHFPRHADSMIDADYFSHLTAEASKINKAGTRTEWVKLRPRNEALDCAVYARAAMEFVKPPFPRLKQLLAAAAEKLPQEIRDAIREEYEAKAADVQLAASSRSSESSPRSPSPKPETLRRSSHKRRKKRIRLPGFGFINGS